MKGPKEARLHYRHGDSRRRQLEPIDRLSWSMGFAHTARSFLSNSDRKRVNSAPPPSFLSLQIGCRALQAALQAARPGSACDWIASRDCAPCQRPGLALSVPCRVRPAYQCRDWYRDWCRATLATERFWGRDWCRDCSAAATEPTETRAAPRGVGARAVQKMRHRDASARPVTRGQTAGPGSGPAAGYRHRWCGRRADSWHPVPRW